MSSSPYGRIIPPYVLHFGAGLAIGIMIGAALVAAIFIFGHDSVWH